MNPSLLLRDATVQEIQLELLRRTKFNDFDGERVCASLLKHRDLWLATILDRPGMGDYAEPCLLLISGLIKLRDLNRNLWNADQLFILTKTHDEARQLARIAEEENWFGEAHVYDDQEEVDRALGARRRGNGLLSVWWD